MARKTFTQKDTLNTQVRDYGLTDTARHYLRLAHAAGERFNINLLAEKNSVALVEAAEMRRLISVLNTLLADDSKTMSDPDN